ncbi:pyridoxal phosphate-dependent aminotransferase [Sorangium sp. So ce1128]
MLAKRTQIISSSKTSGVRTLAQALASSGPPIANFAAGELDSDTSEFIKQAAARAISAGHNKYTATGGIGPLRAIIAQQLAAETGTVWGYQDVVLTAGAKQALFNTAMVLFDPGDEVIIPAPYWTTFPTQVRIAGAAPVFLDTSETGFHVDVDALAAKLTPRTKGIILNTPNNPTGAICSPELLDAVARLAIEHRIVIIFDECYREFTYPPFTHTNIVARCPEVRPLVVLINSFSKSHALTGWRLGYAAGPRVVIEAIEALQSHTTSNPNVIAQHAVLAALERGEGGPAAAMRQRLAARREAGLKLLSTIRDIVVSQPEGGFYFYLKVANKLGCRLGAERVEDVDQLAELLLHKARCAVVPGSAFGDPVGIRISYAIGEEELYAGLCRLSNVLNALQ